MKWSKFVTFLLFSGKWNDVNMMELYKAALRLRCSLLCYDKDFDEEQDSNDPQLPNVCTYSIFLHVKSTLFLYKNGFFS